MAGLTIGDQNTANESTDNRGYHCYANVEQNQADPIKTVERVGIFTLACDKLAQIISNFQNRLVSLAIIHSNHLAASLERSGDGTWGLAL
jgi:hypothetical protein